MSAQKNTIARILEPAFPAATSRISDHRVDEENGVEKRARATRGLVFALPSHVCGEKGRLTIETAPRSTQTVYIARGWRGRATGSASPNQPGLGPRVTDACQDVWHRQRQDHEARYTIDELGGTVRHSRHTDLRFNN